MNVSPTQIRPNCPACGALVSAEVRQVIDVGQEPDLKRRLLRGQLNVAVCPSCSARVAVATPLAYHDPEKELFLTLIPGQMALSAEEQDKTIGELTNLVMNSLPPERRKAYLFQPKTFFSMDSLFSEILRADGITDEMMQRQ
ncbi:MAG TPA: CpXC domain-containing protein, partial [Anaerolineae bacterium]|nr:CpXC domain-containing protein [Anaerolineae bacterium]